MRRAPGNTEALIGDVWCCAQVIREEEEEQEEEQRDQGNKDLSEDAKEEEEQAEQEEPEPVSLAPATSEENLQDEGLASYCYGSQVRVGVRRQ